jgi:hypothetical protein
MLNTKISHSEPKILLQQQNNQKTKDAHGDVRQDKRAKTSARTAGTHLRRDTVIPQWFQASKAAAASDGHAVHC